MAELIELTEGLVRVTSGSDVQPLYTAVDVLRFDSLDILISAAFESPTSPILNLSLLSGNQCATTDGWITSSFSPAVRSSGGAALQNGAWNVSSLLFRYVRWGVAQFGGATAAQFRIHAIGRKKGR